MQDKQAVLHARAHQRSGSGFESTTAVSLCLVPACCRLYSTVSISCDGRLRDGGAARHDRLVQQQCDQAVAGIVGVLRGLDRQCGHSRRHLCMRRVMATGESAVPTLGSSMTDSRCSTRNALAIAGSSREAAATTHAALAQDGRLEACQLVQQRRSCRSALLAAAARASAAALPPPTSSCSPSAGHLPRPPPWLRAARCRGYAVTAAGVGGGWRSRRLHRSQSHGAPAALSIGVGGWPLRLWWRAERTLHLRGGGEAHHADDPSARGCCRRPPAHSRQHTAQPHT
jgi:hypothetical protein